VAVTLASHLLPRHKPQTIPGNVEQEKDDDSVSYLASVSITSLAGHLRLHDAIVPVFLNVANAISQG